jgi:hypothetical protein
VFNFSLAKSLADRNNTLNFYGTVIGPQHTLCGRIVPMMAALRLAVCRVASQPLPVTDPAHPFPEWGHNIAHELTRTVFKGIVDMAPQGQRKLQNKIGRVIGLTIRMVIFYWKDVPAVIKQEGFNNLTTAQEQKIEKAFGWQLLLPQASQEAGRPIKTKSQLRRHLVRKLTKFIRQQATASGKLIWFVLNQSPADILEFLQGLVQGFQCFLKPDGEFAFRGKRTEVYFTLLMYWPEIEEMRQAQPPVTRPFLLRWLNEQEGKEFSDDKIFSGLCEDINLDLARPGHPFKINER